jgi:hypothetical protein
MEVQDIYPEKKRKSINEMKGLKMHDAMFSSFLK